MSLYSLLAAIHVIAAVGGVGQLSVIALMSRKPQHANLQLMLQLFRAVGGSLIIMLITGVAMLWITDWVYEHAWWLRIGFLLFVALGASHGIGQSTLKKIIASGQPLSTSALAGKLRTLMTVASILLVLIVFLMEGKPF